MNTSAKTARMTKMAMLVAVSIVLMAVIRIPFPPAPFLEYDPADVPILIGAFAFGPVAGLILTVIVCLVQGVTVSAASGPIGILMHFFATGSYVLTAGLIYKANKTKKGAILGLIAGVFVMTTTMVIWNIIFTPIFMGISVKEVLPMLIPIIIPFNLLKSGINGVVTYLTYKSISGYLHR